MKRISQKKCREYSDCKLHSLTCVNYPKLPKFLQCVWMCMREREGGKIYNGQWRQLSYVLTARLNSNNYKVTVEAGMDCDRTKEHNWMQTLIATDPARPPTSSTTVANENGPFLLSPVMLCFRTHRFLSTSAFALPTVTQHCFVLFT